MLEKLAGIEARYEELNTLMSDPAVTGDYNRLRQVGQERSELEPIVEAFRHFKAVQQELEGARGLAEASDDAEMAAMAREEVTQLEQQSHEIEEQLTRLLLPRDPADDKNVIVEIRAGTGGEEAALFAAELYRMYTRYAETRGWTTEMLSANDTGIGGFKEVIFLVKGKGAYSRLKFESGVHRVQRVPVTESSGRIHTSTATVVVLPEVEDVEVHIPDKGHRDRSLSQRGRGRAERPKELDRRAHPPPAHRHRRAVPGRAQPTAKQTARHVHLARAAVRHGTRPARSRNHRRAPQPGGQRGAQRENPHLQLSAGPHHGSPYRQVRLWPAHDVHARRRPGRDH